MNLPLVIEAPRGTHSEKPDEAYTALERLFGDVRRIDLFARKQRPGWTAWGDEVNATPPYLNDNKIQCEATCA